MRTNFNAEGVSNWSVLISAVSLGVVLVAAFWTIVQTQFSYIEKDKEIIRAQLVRADNSFDTRLVKLSDAVDARFLVLRGRLEALIDKRLDVNEFKQFESRAVSEHETLKRQLLLLEQTRPTTGELSGTSKALEARIQAQEERVRALELRLIPQAAPR